MEMAQNGREMPPQKKVEKLSQKWWEESSKIIGKLKIKKNGNCPQKKAEMVPKMVGNNGKSLKKGRNCYKKNENGAGKVENVKKKAEIVPKNEGNVPMVAQVPGKFGIPG